MKKKRKKRLNARGKRKLLIRRMILCLFILIIFAIGIFIWKTFAKDDAPAEPAEEPVVGQEDLTIEQTEAEESTVEEDIRTVKNTATEEHHKTNGLAICMYHYVYDKNNPPEDLNNNYIEVSALEEELQYLIDNEYFFPTWEEVRQYVDGELLLPEKSVVLTFDDASADFLELGVPLFNEYKIPVTSFMITSWGGAEKVAQYKSDYVTFQSHSHDMHRGGGSIGHGGIFTALSHEDAVADLTKSAEICGHGDAFAYPFGDYSDSCIEALKAAGFLCGVTTEYGRANPGDDPYVLPRVRMLEGQSLASFISAIE